MKGWTAPRRPTWLALGLLFVISLPAVTPRLYASDEIEYFAYLRSLWFDRDLSFENEYRYFYDRGIAREHGFHETFLELTTATGRRLNFGTIGCAILWAPFYAAGDLTARAMAAGGASTEVDGFSQPYLTAVTVGSAVYGFLAVVLSVLVARRIVGSGHLAGLAVWLGTPLLFYMYLAPGMSHAVSAFVVAAFVLAWLKVRERWSMPGIAALGALAALMGMVREQDLFIAIGPAVDYVWTYLGAGPRPQAPGPSNPGQFVRHAAVGLAAFAVCFTPQAVSYLVLNGRLGPSPLVGQKMQWYAPYAAGVMFSPEHGLFFWTPLALLGLSGLVLLAARPQRQARLKPGTTDLGATQSPSGDDTRRIAIIGLLMVASQVYVSGSVASWTLAGAFGQRRFVGLTVLLVVGLAWWVREARGVWARRGLAIGVVLAVWWNLALMVQFGAGLMDRQRLELGRNTYNAFVVIPGRLPAIAYRYLMDRESFYRSGPAKAGPYEYDE